MDYKKEIGRRLRVERDKLDWKLPEVESRLNGKLSATRISNYEQGIRMPGPYEIKVLAALYGCSASYLSCLEEDGEMTPMETEMLRNFRALPENLRVATARHIEIQALVYREAVEPPADKWTAPKPKRKGVKRR